MPLSKNFKKILFFWTVFHVFGYVSYLTGLTPSIEKDHSKFITVGYNGERYYKGDVVKDFIFTPEYDERYEEERLFPDCSNCEYGEKENFWPFHKFTYIVQQGYSTKSGLVGIWGYYGHYEFLFYVVFPFTIILLSFIYQKYF